MAWAEARSLCEGLGGRLPQPTSAARNDALRVFLDSAGLGSQASGVWLGAHEQWAGDAGEGSWVWAHDGSSLPSGEAGVAQGNSRFAFWASWPASCAALGSSAQRNECTTKQPASHPVQPFANWGASEPKRAGGGSMGSSLRLHIADGTWHAAKFNWDFRVVCEGICPPPAPPASPGPPLPPPATSPQPMPPPPLTTPPQPIPRLPPASPPPMFPHSQMPSPHTPTPPSSPLEDADDALVLFGVGVSPVLAVSAGTAAALLCACLCCVALACFYRRLPGRRRELARQGSSALVEVTITKGAVPAQAR